MFGQFRKHKQKRPEEQSSGEEGASTFTAATSGGRQDVPEVIPADGGSQAAYVDAMLAQAKAYAEEHGVLVGEEFTFTLAPIPRGIGTLHEVVSGLMMSAYKYGLRPGFMYNEKIRFTRLSEPPLL